MLAPRGKVLIVDDEASIQRLLMQKLASEAYYCVVAADGEQALEEIRRHNFAVVLLDIGLPGISGLEVLRQLNKLQPSACTVMISGHGELPVAVESMKLGAYDYISKPFDFTDLMARVSNAVQRHNVLQGRQNREKSLEETVRQQGDEIRGLVGQTVQSLVREHIVERRGNRRNTGPKEIREMAQTVQSFVGERQSGAEEVGNTPENRQRARVNPLTEQMKRLRGAFRSR